MTWRETQIDLIGRRRFRSKPSEICRQVRRVDFSSLFNRSFVQLYNMHFFTWTQEKEKERRNVNKNKSRSTVREMSSLSYSHKDKRREEKY